MSARRTRGRPSRIEAIGGEHPHIQATLDELLRRHVPQQTIIRRLEGLLAEVGERRFSAAAMSRYAREFAEYQDDLGEAKAFASAIVEQHGEGTGGEIGQLTDQLLQSACLGTVRHIRRQAREGDAEIDPETINTLALARQRLARTAEIDERRRRQIRAEVAAEAADAAVEAAREVSRDAGNELPPEALAVIRRDVYGIHDAAA